MRRHWYIPDGVRTSTKQVDLKYYNVHIIIKILK